ncbi:MAG: hypothetical protein PHZ07_03425 [Patescibacteria group bacterium]|nr:hypothetical protein [Patescibacteria group bacterium]MDD4304415.1 hypothetical protein [Patescibacteria group bacterium]MDD4695438.1 hypothetical protein [Patescibacteria group bacterium]
MNTINWIANITFIISIIVGVWGIILRINDYYKSKKWEKQQKKTD